MYAFAVGTPKDDVKAVYWYGQAAAQGNADGEMHLGEMYRYGRGVPQDEIKAALWFARAAAQGQVDAQDALADDYRMGKGVSQDDAKAAQLYALAAEQGYPDAQVNLGYAYEAGNGVKQSYATDLKWALITRSMLEHKPLQYDPTSQYNPNEIDTLTLLHMSIDLTHLSPTQIEAAKLAATAWLAPRGEVLDASLLPKPRRIHWQLTAEATAAILCAYALAKSLQRRRLAISRQGQGAMSRERGSTGLI
jgi:hypothetical protein